MLYYLDKKILNTKDYLIASNFIIIKSGWRIIFEDLITKKKIALMARNDVEEDRNVIYKLKSKELAIEFNFDLEDGLKILK
mgnify:FL=1